MSAIGILRSFAEARCADHEPIPARLTYGTVRELLRIIEEWERSAGVSCEILEGLLLDLEAGASHGKGGQQVSRPPVLSQVSPGARRDIERAIRLAVRILRPDTPPGILYAGGGGDAIRGPGEGE